MFIVGITGGIGSGKTAVTNKLQQLNVKVVDADIVAREVVEPGQPALSDIAEKFGKSILLTDGSLDRAQLRKIVFSEPTAKNWLEGLLHPQIRDRIVQQLNQANSAYAVLASPLLLETDQHKLCQHIVVVDSSEELQLSRTTQRDNNSEDQIKAIIAAQMPREKRLAKANSVISNESDLQSLHQQTETLHLNLSKLAEEWKETSHEQNKS